MFDFFAACNASVAVEPIVHPTPQECEYCSPVEHRCTIPLFQEERRHPLWRLYLLLAEGLLT